MMCTFDLKELVQLAATFCPVVLLDLPGMTEADLYGVLTWLRRKAKEATP